MVKDSLERINQWVSRKAPKNKTLSLNRGVPEALLHQLEALIQKKLPQDFKELYLLNNGSGNSNTCGNLFYGMDFNAFDKILEDYNRRVNETRVVALNNADAEINHTNLFNPHWLCLSFGGDPKSLRVDLCPTVKGTYGQVILIDEENKSGVVVARSLDELLEIFANDLESGLYSGDE